MLLIGTQKGELFRCDPLNGSAVPISGLIDANPGAPISRTTHIYERKSILRIVFGVVVVAGLSANAVCCGG
jgi:hypothetical protein